MISITNNRGRAVKFTPERIEQIRNLVERGTSREEIAEIIGCTVGSLQVTCSRLGISLRRPRALSNGVAALPRTRPPPIHPAFPPIPPISFPTSPPLADVPGLALVLVDGDRRRETPLPVDRGTLHRLAMEAAIRGVPMAVIVAEWLARAASLKD